MDFMYKRRKRKVTDDWRNFIRPLSWRLKWTEIRLKQLKSQEFKYRRELKKCDMETRKAKVRRRRRKKIEDTADVATYTQHHPLFSYLGKNLFLAFIYLYSS
jgi:hypothetical protein